MTHIPTPGDGSGIAEIRGHLTTIQTFTVSVGQSNVLHTPNVGNMRPNGTGRIENLIDIAWV